MNVPGIKSLGANRQNRSLFNSKYPIIAAPMNQVSELSLALAVSKAGGFPSMSGYCYLSDDELIYNLERFVDLSGTSNLILAIDEKSLLNGAVLSTIKRLKISHIFRHANEDPTISVETKLSWKEIINRVLEELPCTKISLKQNFDEILDTNVVYFIKGNDGAGRPGVASTKELFDYHISKNLNAKLVPMGGIGTNDQVMYYLTKGAPAVACGTLFAASVESILSTESKNALINSSKQDLSIIDNRRNQLGLVFKKLKNDTPNNTNSLKAGIKTGKEGLLFAGHSVDQIRSIETVESIILRLTNNFR